MSLTRRLIAAGFTDLEKSERFLGAPELSGIDEEALFAGFLRAANPDMALQSLVRLLSRVPSLGKLVNDGTDRSEALFREIGASEALAEFVMRHPENVDLLAADLRAEPAQVPSRDLRTSLLESVRAGTRSEERRVGKECPG